MNSEVKIVEAIHPKMKETINTEINGLTFTKNFRSASAEEWYIFLPNYQEPKTGGAAGKALIHYNLYGNKEIFINTIIIFDDPRLYDPNLHYLVYSLAEELVNRLVGYADTLLAVHAGENSYHAEFRNNE